MRLRSYIVRFDRGFAPNPFHGFCTLATCKPVIRRAAEVGDFVVGTGSKERGREGHLVYFMVVGETLTYDEYWSDPRFRDKRPDLRRSRMKGAGDNIYHTVDGEWVQEPSYHSKADGSPDLGHVKRDTQDGPGRVLIGSEFSYWGGSGPLVPERFRGREANIVASTQGHIVKRPAEITEAFVDWLRGLPEHGLLGRPTDWPSS